MEASVLSHDSPRAGFRVTTRRLRHCGAITHAISLTLLLSGAWGGTNANPWATVASQAPGGANARDGKQPCAAQPAATVKDKAAEAAFKEYKGWKKVNDQPVLSETHGNRWVFTYLNKKAAAAGLAGKFPFPRGAVLAKESFENEGGKPGLRGPLFVMEKRGKGYDPANDDWHYAVVNPDGTVAMSGSGREGHATQFCAGCHESAKVNDYVFGKGTVMKVKPVTP